MDTNYWIKEREEFLERVWASYPDEIVQGVRDLYRLGCDPSLVLDQVLDKVWGDDYRSAGRPCRIDTSAA